MSSGSRCCWCCCAAAPAQSRSTISSGNFRLARRRRRNDWNVILMDQVVRSAASAAGLRLERFPIRRNRKTLHLLAHFLTENRYPFFRKMLQQPARQEEPRHDFTPFRDLVRSDRRGAALATPAFAAETMSYTPDAFAAAQKAGKPILVAIHASWCPTCKAQKPILSE